MIKVWLTRDENGDLSMHMLKPTKHVSSSLEGGYWRDEMCESLNLPEDHPFGTGLTWGDDPREIEEGVSDENQISSINSLLCVHGTSYCSAFIWDTR